MSSSVKARETQPSQSSPPGCYRDVQPGDAEVRFPAPTRGSVPGQNTNASTKTNHRRICLLNNVSIARGGGSHPFAMRKQLLIFSVFEEGESWLSAVMYQESSSKLRLFSFWRFQWCWPRAKSSALWIPNKAASSPKVLLSVQFNKETKNFRAKITLSLICLCTALDFLNLCIGLCWEKAGNIWNSGVVTMKLKRNFMFEFPVEKTNA